MGASEKLYNQKRFLVRPKPIDMYMSKKGKIISLDCPFNMQVEMSLELNGRWTKGLGT
jgi:hypothetical protein